MAAGCGADAAAGAGDRRDVSGGKLGHAAPSEAARTVWRWEPSRLLPISTTSPAWRYFGGLPAWPTPAGVPVLMMSPGSRAMNWLMYRTRVAGEKIISAVLESCVAVPLTQVHSVTARGSGSSSKV